MEPDITAANTSQTNTHTQTYTLAHTQKLWVLPWSHFL